MTTWTKPLSGFLSTLLCASLLVTLAPGIEESSVRRSEVRLTLIGLSTLTTSKAGSLRP